MRRHGCRRYLPPPGTVSLRLKKSASPFPVPNWTAVYEHHDGLNLPETEKRAFWINIGREWMHLLRSALGISFKIYESPNFWLVSDQPERTARHLIAWAEAAHRKVLQLVDVGAEQHLYGKCPILAVPDWETYDRYCSTYISEEHMAPSSGVFLNEGYGHFIFPFYDISQAEPILVHELAHSLVSHLPLPLWVNEGVAQLCENILSGSDHFDYAVIKAHSQTFWTRETVQEFWNGSGFGRMDEGQIANYHLAREVVRELAADRNRFLPFVREAKFTDSGSDAVMKYFGMTLGELVSDYLGDGDWSPRPVEQNPKPDS